MPTPKMRALAYDLVTELYPEGFGGAQGGGGSAGSARGAAGAGAPGTGFLSWPWEFRDYFRTLPKSRREQLRLEVAQGKKWWETSEGQTFAGGPLTDGWPPGQNLVPYLDISGKFGAVRWDYAKLSKAKLRNLIRRLDGYIEDHNEEAQKARRGAKYTEGLIKTEGKDPLLLKMLRQSRSRAKFHARKAANWRARRAVARRYLAGNR